MTIYQVVGRPMVYKYDPETEKYVHEAKGYTTKHTLWGSQASCLREVDRLNEASCDALRRGQIRLALRVSREFDGATWASLKAGQKLIDAFGPDATFYYGVRGAEIIIGDAPPYVITDERLKFYASRLHLAHFKYFHYLKDRVIEQTKNNLAHYSLGSLSTALLFIQGERRDILDKEMRLKSNTPWTKYRCAAVKVNMTEVKA